MRTKKQIEYDRIREEAALRTLGGLAALGVGVAVAAELSWKYADAFMDERELHTIALKEQVALAKLKKED